MNERIADKDIEILGIKPWNPGLKFVALIDVLKHNPFPPISFLFKRAAYDEIGPFREDLPVVGDWEFNLRFLRRFAIDVIPRPLANYHLRGDVMSGAYSNTVVGALDLHERTTHRVREELLRKALQSGQFGIGTLMAVVGAGSGVAESGSSDAALIKRVQFDLLSGLALRLRKNGTKDVVVYGAGEAGRQFATIAHCLGLRIALFVDGNQARWGDEILNISVASMEQAVAAGLHRYVVSSFEFGDEIENTIRNYYTNTGLAEPEVFRIWS